MYNYYLDMCSSMYAYFDDIYLSFMDHTWKKGKTLFCAKIGIIMPLLTFKFNAQIQEEFYNFDGLSMFQF
jgi:hypothetical protein